MNYFIGVLVVILIGVGIGKYLSIKTINDREKKALQIRQFFRDLGTEFSKNNLWFTVTESKDASIYDRQWQITGKTQYLQWGYQIIVTYELAFDLFTIEFALANDAQEVDEEVHGSLLGLITKYVERKDPDALQILIGETYSLSDQMITSPEQLVKSVILQKDLYHHSRILTHSDVKDLAAIYLQLRVKQDEIKNNIAEFFGSLEKADKGSATLVEFVRRDSVPPASA